MQFAGISFKFCLFYFIFLEMVAFLLRKTPIETQLFAQEGFSPSVTVSVFPSREATRGPPPWIPPQARQQQRARPRQGDTDKQSIREDDHIRPQPHSSGPAGNTGSRSVSHPSPVSSPDPRLRPQSDGETQYVQQVKQSLR